MTISANQLTDWLRSAGTLPAGRVTRATIELEERTTVSTLTFVRVEYSADAPGELPTSVVVKQPLASGSAPNVAAAEVDFYRRLAPESSSPPLVRCLAAIEPQGGGGHILVLEDLRATHDHKPWPLPPSQLQSDAAVDALAAIHSRWWERAELGRTIGAAHTTESLTTMVQGIAATIPGFLDSLGDAVPVGTREIYERVFSSSLQPWLRLTSPRALTVAHGDAHPWNILLPRNGVGAAFVIDWQLWHVDVGARDLAFFIALHWYPELRRERELPTLRRYHERLVAAGVQGYSFDDLMLDYRRSVVRNLTFPPLLWNRGLAPEAWFHRLECALAAYRDLGCDDVLNTSA